MADNSSQEQQEEERIINLSPDLEELDLNHGKIKKIENLEQLTKLER